MQYPRSRRTDHVDTYHGVTVADPYRWLEDDHAEETAEWVREQNALTFGYLETIPEREKFRARLRELWNRPRLSPPLQWRKGLYLFSRNEGLQNQAVLYTADSPDATGEILLDPNAFSADGTIAMTGWSLSNDASLLCYGLSEGGSDWQELHVRRVDTRQDLPDIIRWVKFSLSYWTHDNAGFFYSRFPEPEGTEALSGAQRDHRLYYHRLGTDQSEDLLIYERPEEPDARLFSALSSDGRYLNIYVHRTGQQNLLLVIDLIDPLSPVLDAPIIPLFDRYEASYSVIDNDGPIFYIKTDNQAPRERIVAVDIGAGAASMRTLIAESDDVMEGATMVQDRFILTYLHDAYSRIAIHDNAGVWQRDLQLPTLGTVAGVNARRSSNEVYYGFTSYLHPLTIFRYDLSSGENTLFRSPVINLNTDGYETRQIRFRSKDGTMVPMFITHRKGLKLDGNNPTLLYGYGGFNVSLTPAFSPSTILWLEQGGVYAVPNLRGGGEFGLDWYRAGTLHQKQNVFDDFIAAAEYLIAQGYTTSRKLVLEGGSNGGLLVGAVMCQRPDLFAVAIPAVGVMDMLRYHRFTIGIGWQSDYGISDDPEHFKTLYAYSPLHNLKAGTRYPATLVVTGDHDDRVVPAHSFKFAARLQECQAGDAPVLIRVETKGGHGGGKPIAMIIEEEADIVAFALRHTR